MPLSRLIRRTHLLSAMLLWPWLLMYGVSAVVFNHPLTGGKNDETWRIRSEQLYDRPADRRTDLQQTATAILQDFKMGGPFQARRSRGNIFITVFTFFSDVRLTYLIKERKLIIEERDLSFRDSLTRMHARGGFERSAFLSDLWASIVDLQAFALLFWVASGLYMWLQNPALRKSGVVVLSLSTLTFLYFLFTL